MEVEEGVATFIVAWLYVSALLCVMEEQLKFNSTKIQSPPPPGPVMARSEVSKQHRRHLTRIPAAVTKQASDEE